MTKNITRFLIFIMLINLITNSVLADNVFFSKKQETPEDIVMYSTVYKEATYNISIVDPTIANNAAGKSFPGLRGSGQLIIYTPKFGLRTGTNEYGSEAIVVNGIVAQVNGADSIIPANGFVISGHGSAKKWINENISVGTKIDVDWTNNILKIFITPDSFVFNAKLKIKEVQNIMNDYNSMNIYYDDRKSLYYISKSKEFILKAQRDEKNVQKYSSLAIMAADKALENSVPYNPEELKGVWIRPTENSPSQIQKTLDTLKNAGISDIFLETYYHGTTIYPSEVLYKYGVSNQRNEFKGFDPLKVWVDEAHARKMKVHIWFETFYVGNEYSASNPFNVLNVYPTWRNTTKLKFNSDKPVASASEHNGYFIDPANPEVQKYLLEIINEIVSKYKPDGINLDYIRYPQSIAAKYAGYDSSNWGYSEYARNDFMNRYGIDPINIKYPSNEWDIWAKYRQDKITDFVKKTRDITCRNNVMLSAVIFPDRQRSLETKMQDWRTWSVNSYLDALTPLILTCDKQTATLLIKDIMNNTTVRTKVYPGLFVPFMGGQPNDLLRQIHENRKLQNSGVILFDYAHLSDKYINSLTASVFNSGAIGPVKPDSIFNDTTAPKKEPDKKKGFLIFKSDKKENINPLIYSE